MIFIVTDGSYSNFSIQAVFSTEEKAKQYILDQTDAAITDHAERVGEFNIETWELDKPYETLQFETIYEAVLELESGHRTAQSWDHRPYDQMFERSEVYYPKGWRGAYIIKSPLVSAVSRVSMEHAVKLAVEGRQEWLRKK